MENTHRNLHMTTYTDITRPGTDYDHGHNPTHDETLHLADETNHTQWINLDDVNNPEPFEGFCYQCGKHHHWRRVWVIA